MSKRKSEGVKQATVLRKRRCDVAKQAKREWQLFMAKGENYFRWLDPDGREVGFFNSSNRVLMRTIRRANVLLNADDAAKQAKPRRKAVRK